jgi:hypothetical protein
MLLSASALIVVLWQLGLDANVAHISGRSEKLEIKLPADRLQVGKILYTDYLGKFQDIAFRTFLE